MKQSRLHAAGGDCATISNPTACCVTVIDTLYISPATLSNSILTINYTFWMFQQSFTPTDLHVHVESVPLEQPTFSIQEFYFHMHSKTGRYTTQ